MKTSSWKVSIDFFFFCKSTMSELPKNILQAVTAANDRIEESVRHADGSTTYYLKTRFREYHQIVNHYEKKHKTPKVHMRMEEVDAANGCKTEGWRVSIEVIPVLPGGKTSYLIPWTIIVLFFIYVMFLVWHDASYFEGSFERWLKLVM